MTSTKKDPVLVVLQLTGGNDYMNTVIPHAEPLYRDKRPVVGVPDERILKLNDSIGFHPELAPLRRFWDAGDMAIIHGVGYANSPRSHFRSMDIWHTCEPDKLGTEGWLGRAARDIDPNKENVVTAVSFGPSLPRALALPGVPVACVDDLENFGMLTSIQEEMQRDKIIDRFTRLYSPTIGNGFVMDYLGQTGLDGLKAADILKVAPETYSSTVEYPDTPIARKLKGISQVHQADLGARVLYCDHGSFDSHSNQVGMHDGLWRDVSAAVSSFFDDLRENNASDNVILMMFSEFGAAGSTTTAPAPTTAPPASCWSWATRSRAASTASTRPPSPRTWNRATWFPAPTSAAFTPPSWKTGWAWTPILSSAGPSRKSRLSNRIRVPVNGTR